MFNGIAGELRKGFFIALLTVIIILVVALALIAFPLAPRPTTTDAEPLSSVVQPLATLAPEECYMTYIEDLELNEDGTMWRKRVTKLRCCLDEDGKVMCKRMDRRYPDGLEWQR